jgi:hypothetical protein
MTSIWHVLRPGETTQKKAQYSDNLNLTAILKTVDTLRKKLTCQTSSNSTANYRELLGMSTRAASERK